MKTLSSDVLQLLHDRHLESCLDRMNFRRCVPDVKPRPIDAAVSQIVSAMTSSSSDVELHVHTAGFPTVTCRLMSCDKGCELGMTYREPSFEKDFASYRQICRQIAKLFRFETVDFYIHFRGKCMRHFEEFYQDKDTILCHKNVKIVSEGDFCSIATAEMAFPRRFYAHRAASELFQHLIVTGTWKQTYT